MGVHIISHSVIAHGPYYGWPTVARFADGTLVVAASGNRVTHIDPWGVTSLFLSRDEGATWSAERIIGDSPLDDRDAGILPLDGTRALVTLFTSDTRHYTEHLRANLSAEDFSRACAVMDSWSEETVARELGSFVLLGDIASDAPWERIRVPVTSPHGPVRLRDRSLLYIGKRYDVDGMTARHFTDIWTARSRDEGRTWTLETAIPLPEGVESSNFHEPYLIELTDGTILAAIRYEHAADAPNGYPAFATFVCESRDGGSTFSVPRMLCEGSPPHLLEHSSGTVIMTIGNRNPPYGEQVLLSRDGGASWSKPIDIFAGAPDGDLGYPSTAELADGSLFSVYYQKEAPGARCSLMATHWELIP